MSGPPVLFAGPTLWGVEPEHIADVLLRGPVRRGSVDDLVDEFASPGVMIVADGTFHQYPSVGHAELRRALGTGWQVWGVSSMGAIRAAEMRHMGMRGFGFVYDRYAADPEFKDDEVALLHWAKAPFKPVTEPLVHIRALLDDLVLREVISREHKSHIATELEGIWYGYRTLDLLHRLLRAVAHLEPQTALAEIDAISEFRVKTQDLLSLLRSRPWLI